MFACFFTMALGIVMIVLGIVNRRGNINSLHSYHRHRVAEKDRLPLGRIVGLGPILIGASCISFGALMLAYELSGVACLEWIALSLLFVGLAVGGVITCRGILKYNGGLF